MVDGFGGNDAAAQTNLEPAPQESVRNIASASAQAV